MGKRTRLWRSTLVIIIAIFLLTLPACGKKGDPIPPQSQQPKTGTSTELPARPAGENPVK
jgi:predicted small lipoprotein YifL